MSKVDLLTEKDRRILHTDRPKKPKKIKSSQSETSSSRGLSTLYYLLSTLIALVPSAIYTLYVRGGQLSGLAPSEPVPSLIGLESLRADLFRQGLSLPDGYADLMIGPLISQSIAVFERLGELIPSGVNLPEQLHTHLLLIATMVGIIWGGALLYRLRRLSIAAGMMGAVSIGLVSCYELDWLWFLMIYTWVCVGLTASWRDPSSSLRAGLCGISLSLGVAASPLFLPVAGLYWVLSFWPRPREEGERWWSAISILPPLMALFSFGVGMLPWLFRGQLSHPPLTTEQYLSPELWRQVAHSIELKAPLVEVYHGLAPLIILGGLTFMSAHTHRVSWSRRGIGLGALILLALLIAPIFGWLCAITPLIWVASHPWSPMGTFVLLPFKPIFKRAISLCLFGVLLLPSSLEVVTKFNLRRVEALSPLQQEQLALTKMLNGMQELERVWVAGSEAYPLYAMTRLSASALLPPQLGPTPILSLRGIDSLLKSELIDVIIISEQYREFTKKSTDLRRLLEREYREIPASDYGWLESTNFAVYLKNEALPSSQFNRAEKDEDLEAVSPKPQSIRAVPPPIAPPTRLKVEPELTDHSQDEDSKGEDEDSKGEDEDSKGEDEDSKREDEESKGEDEDSKGEDEDSKGEDEESKGEDEESKGEDEDSKGEDEDSMGEDEDSKGEDEDSKGEDEDSKGEDEDSKGEDEDSKGEDEDSKGEDEDSKGEDEDSKAKGDAPKDTRKPKKTLK